MKKMGNETFSNGVSLLSFWQWAHSDILNNAERGRLAEYIVAMALDVTKAPRIEWDAYDLMTEDGIKIEVKSSAYLQTWKQNGFSKILFDIAPKRFWDENTHRYSEELSRKADVYVFCLFSCTDMQSADPLNFDQWDFYVISTTYLNSALPHQKTLSLSALRKIPHRKVVFSDIQAAVREAAEEDARIQK